MIQIVDSIYSGFKIRPIPGYTDRYYVSTDGNVYSFVRRDKNGDIVFKELSASKDDSGYVQVGISDADGHFAKIRVHRLVAQTFLPNPDNLPQINHINEDKTDNCIDNLEWCDNQYNINYGTRNARASKAIGKPVLCVETGITYESATKASLAVGISRVAVSNCCRGYTKTACGYHWRYLQKNKNGERH